MTFPRARPVVGVPVMVAIGLAAALLGGSAAARLSKSVAKARIEPERGRLFGDGFEGVGREGCGGGLLGRVLLVRRVVAEASEYVFLLHLDCASRMVGRRLACRDAPRLASTSLNPRDRTLTREIVT